MDAASVGAHHASMGWWRGALVVAAAVASGPACGGESLGGGMPPGLGGAGMVAAGGSLGTGTGGDVGTGGPPPCGGTQVVPVSAPVPPDILILMDRSSSLLDDTTGMTCPGGCGARSKWAQLSAGIESIVVSNASLNWGLMFFGTDDACDVNSGPAIPVAPNPAAPMTIDAALAGTTPGGDAPTAPALSAATEYLHGLADVSPKYILLVTDGRSGCEPDGASPDVAAEVAVSNAVELGIPTFVLAAVPTSDATAIATLNQMAVNGGQQQVGGANSFYTTADDLGAQLDAPVSLATSCTLLLEGPYNLPLEVTAQLKDGTTEAIAEDPVNGWLYTDSSARAIIFNGTSCENAQQGAYSQISVGYECPLPINLGHSQATGR